MRRSVVLLVAAGFLAVGCTAGEQAVPAPPTSSSPSVPTEAPPVSNTVDLTPWLERRCEVLTPEQVAAMPGLAEDAAEFAGLGTVDDFGGEACVWDGAEGTTGTLAIRLGIGRDGVRSLEDAYRRNVLYDDVREIEIDGAPALVQHDFNVTCQVTIGVGQEQVIAVAYAEAGITTDDWCGIALPAAEAVLATVRAGPR